MTSPRVEDIDWAAWRPTERATLLFVVRDGKVLLIHKKKGLGAGKINAPGGRIEPGELPQEAAIREVQEELGITPLGVEPRGELKFQFVDGYSILAHVFVAQDCDGPPRETDEARPLWTPLDRIPYERMWADDRVWLPWVLEGGRVHGRFVFDDDRMLDYAVSVESG